MGYCIDVEGNLRVKAENVRMLHRLLCELLTDEKHRQHMGGGSSDGEKWFSWCNGASPKQQLPDLIKSMRWTPAFDALGNVTLTFRGEKLGDEQYILNFLAPVIDPESSLIITGEDGCCWRWYFDGKRLCEVDLPRREYEY